MRKIVRAVICLLAVALSVPVVLDQSVRAANQDQTSPSPAIGQPDASAHMQTVQGKKDVPAEMHNAVDQLKVAKADLEKAGGEWGGHKANAINYINEALKEIDLAADYPHQHGTY
jgi:hypothetical protein